MINLMNEKRHGGKIRTFGRVLGGDGRRSRQFYDNLWGQAKCDSRATGSQANR
jgi:hypothetical protein